MAREGGKGSELPPIASELSLHPEETLRTAPAPYSPATCSLPLSRALMSSERQEAQGQAQGEGLKGWR